MSATHVHSLSRHSMASVSFSDDHVSLGLELR